MQNQAFTPGQTLTLSVTTASGSGTFTGGNIGSQSCILQNGGSTICFVRFTVGASTAAIATDFPMPAGAIMTVCKGNADTVSAISSGTTTLYATAGEGQ